MTTTTPTSGAADLPKAQYPAAERDELLQVAIDFIGTLTGMKPPPIEVAPPEVFAPFRAFVDQVQSVTSRYAALAAGQATAAKQAPECPSMPETWHVVAHVLGEPILSIGYDWLSGKGELTEAETQAVIGMAQHMLAFVGYGLPPSSFDPDADEATAAQAVVPAGWKLVPTEPTHNMLAAMAECDGWLPGDRDRPGLTRWEDYWRMAIAAAPPQPAAQQGAAYAAPPSHEHQLAIMEGERNASLDAYSRVVSITSAESRLYERAFTSGWDRRDRLASYGQAPAQAAPAAVAGPSEFPHEQMDVIAMARYKVMPSHESMFHRFAVVAGDGEQQLYLGRETECQNMARKFVGAFLDGAFYQSQAKVPTPSPHAEDTQQAPAQAAPAAVAGQSEAVKFTDQSTADPVEKARRYLTAMGDQRTNSSYFYDDGYPRRESAQDALATLAVLEQLAAAPTTQPSPQPPERDASVPAEQQGLFRKFDVRRVDGSDKPGGKHHGCTYFVLDVDHDPCARPALAAYAAACEATHPALAADLRTKWGAVPTTQPAPNEDEGISREQWIEQAMRVYLIAGDTEQQAEECAKYLWGELDLDDLADPYDAAMSDVEGRGPAPQPSPAAQGDAARWRMLPAFIEQYQIDYVELLRDIDAARAAQEGKSHDN